MAKKAWTFDTTHSSAATFAVWGKALSDALTEKGLPKTADTGQINWLSPPAYNGTGGTAMGYENRRFDDALQATAPIFIKIEYGTGASSTNKAPGIWVTVGTGSD